jgi:hypothetical protein
VTLFLIICLFFFTSVSQSPSTPIRRTRAMRFRRRHPSGLQYTRVYTLLCLLYVRTIVLLLLRPSGVLNLTFIFRINFWGPNYLR